MNRSRSSGNTEDLNTELGILRSLAGRTNYREFGILIVEFGILRSLAGRTDYWIACAVAIVII